MEIEDAIHTAILTMKEGYEGSMTEDSLEIGISYFEEEEESGPHVDGIPRKMKVGMYSRWIELTITRKVSQVGSQWN